MSEIVALLPVHGRGVARLHLEQLRTSFRGPTGSGLLEAYYSYLANCSGACGFVAQEQGRILGFACGIWDAQSVRRSMLRQWPRLLFWATAQILAHPPVLAALLRRVAHPDGDRLSGERGYELRPIVVDSAARRRGIGAQLVRAVLQDAGERGYNTVYLHTEQDNSIARAFYAAMGFRPAHKHLSGTTQYLRYERRVPPG